jgi:hypothetical protein
MTFAMVNFVLEAAQYSRGTVSTVFSNIDKLTVLSPAPKHLDWIEFAVELGVNQHR